ncbi:MAG: Ig-like domain-containing protein [Prolixibacteraceae bacterium]|nr:Ig-like domain-containing protein [Prolixibacteraceae bacterium]
MRKSFTRLLSLVMFLTLLSTVSMAALTSVWPSGATALTKTTDKILVIYPEAVQASTGSVRVTKTVGGALVAVLPATDSRISYAKGDTVVIDLSASLQELTDYTVKLDANTFKTVADGSEQLTYTWSFKTGDYTAPTLVSVVPVTGTTLETSQTTVALKMTFEDASLVLAGTGKVAIYKADGNLWDFISVTTATSVSHTTGTNLWEFTLPTSRVLEDNVTYNVTITAGTVTDDGKRADLLPNAFAGLTNRALWTFTTKDYTAPGFATDYPKIGIVTNTAAGVLIKTLEAGVAYAVINTSPSTLTPEAIKNASGVQSVAITTAGTEYAINFITGLSQGTQYYIHVATENSDGVLSLLEAQVAPFTSEITAPTLVAVKYQTVDGTVATGTVTSNVVTTATGTLIPTSFGGGKAVPQDVNNIVLDFSEPVKIGAGNVIIYKASDNTIFSTVAAASLTVDATDLSLVNVPVSGLQNNTKYYITIPNTIVLDVYNNAYGGIYTVSGMPFQTNDIVAPTFTYTPVEGASNQLQDVNVVLTFNELIRTYGTYSLTTAISVEQQNPETGVISTVTCAITSSDNDGKFTTITLDPESSLLSSAVVTVKIALNSLADIGNNVVDVAGQGINFVVEDKVAPLITSWSTLAAPADSVVLTFNEAIYLAGGGTITDATLSSILTVKQTDINGVNVAYTATIDATKSIITIIPSTPWLSETQYYFAISSSLQDAAGNLFLGAGRTSTSTIADVTSATVDLSSVAGLNILPGADVFLKFYEGLVLEPRVKIFSNNVWTDYSSASAATVATAMQKVIVLKEGSATGPDVAFTVTSTDKASFKISANLVGNATYYLGIGASTTDAFDNVNEAKFVTFSTIFDGVPSILSLSPLDGAVQVGAASNFVITYDTPVLKKAGGIVPGDIYITDGTTSVPVTDAEVTIVGSVVTINPEADLATDKSYDIVIDAGVFTNLNKVTSVSGAIASDSWDFLTNDTKLGITGLSPDNMTSPTIDAQLVMTFNEPVVKALGTFKIWNTVTNTLVESIDVISSQVVLSDDQLTVTITPSANFSYNTTYYIEVTPGALKDVYGNGNLEIYGTTNSDDLTNWTFGTPNPALTIDTVLSTPASGSDKVAANANIVITFNREIAAVVGNNSVGYFEGTTATTAQSYIFGSSNVIISGKTLTITHADKLFPALTDIYLYLPANVIQAANDENIRNSLVDRTHNAYSFNTGDVNAPVPTFTPVSFATSQVYSAVDSNITITFDEDIFLAGGTPVSSGDVTSGGLFSIIPDGSSTSIPFVGTISGRTVTLDPTSDLSQFTEYTITVNANKIKDSNGLYITSAISSTFKTVDISAPVITSFVLDGGNTLISVPQISITDPNNSKFYYLLRATSTDLAPTADVIKASNTLEVVGSVVSTFNIDLLLPSTEYQFYYVSEDSFGNTSEVAVLVASTDDTVAPLLVSTYPAVGSVNVDVPSTGIVVTLTFNENVVKGTGVITVRDYATQAVLAVLNQDALGVLTDLTTLNLTIPVSAVTSAAQKFYVEISAGTIEDAAGNDYAGAFGQNTLSYTTEDNLAPAVDVALSTIGTDVALNSTITVAFTEDVKAGTGNLILYTGSVVDADNAIQVFTAAEATFSGNTATVKPTASLINSQAYIVSTELGFAVDLSSNANPNALNTGVQFTATPDVLLSVSSVDPAGGDLPVNKSTLVDITVKFNGNVYLTVAGYHKPLALMTQAELLAHVSLVDGNGTVVPITRIDKDGADGIIVIPGTLYDQTNYTLTISGFENSAGTVMTSYVVNYLTDDATPPTIVFSPAFETSDVNPATALTLTFSEAVVDDAINPNASIYSYIDNTNVSNFVFLKEATVGGADVEFTATISGKVITIVPSAALISGAKYYYGLKRTVEDLSGAAILATSLDTDGHTITTGIEESTYVYFTAADYTVPALLDLTTTNFSPYLTGAYATSEMYVIFSEAVTVSTGSIVIRREDGTIFQSVSGTGLSIDVDNAAKLNIAHNDFEPFTNYFVEIGASVVVDASGNANVKFSDPATGWLFTTNDTYALTASVTPMGDNTPRIVNLQMMFNKDVISGVANKFIAVYKADGTAVSQIATEDLVANERTVVIPVALDANQSYYARVEAGAFVDGSGNLFAGIMDNSWVFSTVDNIAPQVVSLAPADNALSVDAQTSAFTMTFDRDIAVGTGVISVRYAVDGKVFEDVDVTKAVVSDKTLTFNVSKVLDANTAFYVIVPVGAITNTEVTKDSFAGILNTYTWNFTTTTDKTAPKLLTWTPNATTITDNHPTLVMTFDEAVVLGAGNVKIVKKSDNVIALTIPVTAAMVSDKTVTVSYVYNETTGGLDKDTDYYVLVDGGIVKDLAGNAFAGVTASTTWTFKTGADWQTPVVPEISDSQFKVYPNPFVDYVTVSNASELSKVVVSNIAGQIVKEVVAPESTIQLNELRSGVYFITLYQDGAVIKTVKILKR